MTFVYSAAFTSFTGSVPVGKGIAAAAIPNLTKVQMEMGSKNALAVMDDADLDLAVTLALGGAFGGTGQKCSFHGVPLKVEASAYRRNDIVKIEGTHHDRQGGGHKGPIPESQAGGCQSAPG